MILMDEMIPMRLYSAKQKAYIPFNVINKKKGAMITLLTSSIDNSIECINLPYLYNPSYFISYYMNRNVNSYLTRDGKITIEDDEEVDEAVQEAVIHNASPKSPKCNTMGSAFDLRELNKRFSKKSFDKWYDYFKIKKDKRIYPMIYGFNTLTDMAKAIGDKAIMDHGTIVVNSYNIATEIFVLNQSEYMLEHAEGTYDMYCENAIITYIVSVSYRNASWYLANQIGTALSGAADYLYQKNNFNVSKSDRISAAIMISRMEKEYGKGEIIELARTGKYYKLARLGARDFINRIAPMFEKRSKREDAMLEIALDQSIRTPEDLSKWMRKNIKYKEMSSLMTADEVQEKKYGCCHDQVVFELAALKKLGISGIPWLVFEYNENTNQSGETHSFVIFSKNGKRYWFENAWTPKAGIHEVKDHNFIKEMHENHQWGNIDEYPSIEITRMKYEPGDSLQGLIDRSTMNESAILESDGTHMDALRVYNSMDAKDKKFISYDGSYQTSNNKTACYRHIEREGFLTTKGFIECFKDFDNIASIVIGVHPKYRGEGLATKMMEQMLKEFPKENPDINELVWRADVKNTKSRKLAEKFGFELVRESNIQAVYRYEFKKTHKYDDIPKEIISDEKLVKWVRKNFKLDTSFVNGKAEVMSVKDMLKKKNLKQIDIAYFCYKALRKMSLNCIFVVFAEHTVVDNTMTARFGDLHAAVIYWYTPDNLILMDPFGITAKSGMGLVKDLDALFNYEVALHEAYKWGDIDTFPYVTYNPLYNESIDPGMNWYTDVFDLDALLKSQGLDGRVKISLLELSVSNKLAPPNTVNKKLPMNLQRLKKHKITKEIVEKYGTLMDGLHHVRITNNCNGYLFTDPKNKDKPVCYYNVEHKPDRTGTYGTIVWLQAIEVDDEYQQRGLAKQLLQMAIANDGVTNLAVNKNNEVAYRLYQSLGFRQYNINGQMINMQIPKSTKEVYIAPQEGIMQLDEQMYIFTEALSQQTYNTKLRQYLYSQRIRNSSMQVLLNNRIKESCPVIRKTFTSSAMYGGLNLYYDLSYYNQLFLNNNETTRDIAIQFYWEFVNRLLDVSKDPALSKYSKNTIFIPVWRGAWNVKDNTYVYDWKENLNPISMIFRMLRKNPMELRSKWGKLDVVFLGKTGYFKVDFSKFELKNLTKFKIRLEKLNRGEIIDRDPDDDGYQYGPSDNSVNSSSAAIAVNVIDKIEDSTGIEINNVSKAVKTSDETIDIKADGSASTIFPNMRIRNTAIQINSNSISIAVMAPSDENIADTIKQQMVVDILSRASMTAFFSK